MEGGMEGGREGGREEVIERERACCNSPGAGVCAICVCFDCVCVCV